MQPFLAQHLLQEEVGDDPLAHEPALQVREHAQDGVDLAGRGELLELLRRRACPAAASCPPPVRRRARRPFARRPRVPTCARSRVGGGGAWSVAALLPSPRRRIASCSPARSRTLPAGHALLALRERELLLRRQHQPVPAGDREVQDAEHVVDRHAVHAGSVGLVQEDRDQRDRGDDAGDDRSGNCPTCSGTAARCSAGSAGAGRTTSSAGCRRSPPRTPPCSAAPPRSAHPARLLLTGRTRRTATT